MIDTKQKEMSADVSKGGSNESKKIFGPNQRKSVVIDSELDRRSPSLPEEDSDSSDSSKKSKKSESSETGSTTAQSEASDESHVTKVEVTQEYYAVTLSEMAALIGIGLVIGFFVNRNFFYQ